MLTNKRIELFPQQLQFLKCQDRFTLFVGGIGSGKTYAGCVKDLMWSSKPQTLGLVIAPTYPMLKDATIRTFEAIAGDAIESLNKSDLVARMRGGGEILFRSADNPNRLRGSSVHWAHIDEGGMCNPETFDIVIGRLRASGAAGHLWITTTPNGRNWLYRRKDEMTVFHAKTRDNPYLAREFVQSLETAYSGEFAKQELEGEFISLEGLVYPMFREDIHVQTRARSEFSRFVLAMDEGYTNPAVILLIGIDGDGRNHVLRCYYETGKLQRDVVAVALDWWTAFRCEYAAVDAAAAGLIADLRDVGIAAIPRKGRVLDGITAVQALLKVQGDGRPRLTVDPACTAMINEYQSYVWREGKDEPVKENDHALDAVRYYAIGAGELVRAVPDPFASW